MLNVEAKEEPALRHERSEVAAVCRARSQSAQRSLRSQFDAALVALALKPADGSALARV
tara:strand:- start:65 stop:241 length:177 start_codon:yes stop_codon:yes gene_type:complete